MQKKINNKIYLSVVIPAYNEENNIRTGALSGMVDYLETQEYSWEMIVVDDGSTDKTADLAQKFANNHKNVRVLREPHRGKGGTVIAGMLNAEGSIVVFDDMDQATPIDQLERILPMFEKGFNVVIGSRSGRKGANLIRKTMSIGFMILRTLILRLPFKDTQCGFKGFRREVVRPIFGKMKVFSDNQVTQGVAVTAGFDLELLYIARKLGYKVAEVPVEWKQKGNRGSSGVNPIKDSWEGLRDLLKVRINAIQGKYKV